MKELKIKLTKPQNYPHFTGRALMYKDLPLEILEVSASFSSIWSKEDIFIDVNRGNGWVYLMECEYTIIE